MKLRLIISLILIVLFLTCVTMVKNKSEEKGDKEIVFQGPVPEGYDELHFRNTGETIKLINT